MSIYDIKKNYQQLKEFKTGLKMNKKTRLIIVGLSIWTFIHAFLLLGNTANFQYSSTGKVFYPQNGSVPEHAKYFDSNYYDYSEFLVYAVLPWMVFLLFRFVKGAKD